MDDAGDAESWEYKGGTFTNTASWRECGGRKLTELEGKLGNKILTWNTDVETTRLQVKLDDRKEGLQISYKLNGENWITEQFIGRYPNVKAYWINDNNWQKIALSQEVEALDTELKSFFGRILEWDTDESTTRLQVPESERAYGLLVSFKKENSKWVTQQFIGEYTVDAYWSNSSYWNTIATTSDISESEVALKKLFGRILEWNTTQADTLNSIPSNERAAGMIVTFKDPSSGWKRLQYTSDTVYTNTRWGNDSSNWTNLDLSKDIDNLNNKVKELDDNKITKQVGKNLADPSEFQVGAYSSTGGYVGNANFMLTGYIPVKSQNLICNKAVTSSGVYGAVFDSNKTWIRNLTNPYTFAEGDYYVRFCFKTLDKDSIQVEVGTESSDFENYTPLNIIKKLEDNIASLEADIAEIGNSQQLSDIKTGLASFGDVIEPFEIKENQYYDVNTHEFKNHSNTSLNLKCYIFKASNIYLKTDYIYNITGGAIKFLDKNNNLLGVLYSGTQDFPAKQDVLIVSPLRTEFIVFETINSQYANLSAHNVLFNIDDRIVSLNESKAVAIDFNWGKFPKNKENLSVFFLGNSFCGQMHMYWDDLVTASNHSQAIKNVVARGGKTYKYWLDDLQYEDTYPEGYLDQDNPTDDGEYDTTFDRTDTLYKRLKGKPMISDVPQEDRKWDIVCICGLPCGNLFNFYEDYPYMIQLAKKIKRIVSNKDLVIYFYVPPVPPAPNAEIGEDNVWGNTYETSGIALEVANQVMKNQMANMGIPTSRLLFGSVAMQNLRNSFQVNSSKEEVMYDTELTIDRLHPMYGLPYLATSLLCYQTILENVYDDIDYTQDCLGIKTSYNASYGGGENYSNVINIGDSNRQYAIDAVSGALIDYWEPLNLGIEKKVVDDMKVYNEQVISENG